MSTVELPRWKGKYEGREAQLEAAKLTKSADDLDVIVDVEEVLAAAGMLKEGEPWFFIRAKDATAPGGVEAYANTLNASAALLESYIVTLDELSDLVDQPLVIEAVSDARKRVAALRAAALDCFVAAEAMRVWQNRNPHSTKIPD